MALSFRPAHQEDYEQLVKIVIEGFEKVTMQTYVDQRFGFLNGTNWRDRWEGRVNKALKNEIVIVGESSAEIASVIAARIDPKTQLAFINILAVSRKYRQKGYGRKTLRWMLAHLKTLGGVHAHLDCLATNVEANRLYESEGFENVGHSENWYIKIP